MKRMNPLKKTVWSGPGRKQKNRVTNEKNFVTIAISMLLILSVCILTVPVKAEIRPVTIYASPGTHDTIKGTSFTFTALISGTWGHNLQYTWSIINADGSSGSWNSGYPLNPNQISSTAVMLGTHTISVTVTDEFGKSASDSYSMTVHKEKEPVIEGTKSPKYGTFARVSPVFGGPFHSLKFISDRTTTFSTSVTTTAGVTAGMVKADFGVTTGVSSSSKIGYELTSNPVDENHEAAMYCRPIYTHKWGHYRQWGRRGLISGNIGTFDFTKQEDPVNDWYYEIQEKPKQIGKLSVSIQGTTPVRTGDSFSVQMIVKNTQSSATVNNVQPSPLTVTTLTGDASATLISGPSPTSANIKGGSSKYFTWSYTASGLGKLTLSGYASGIDAISRGAVTSVTVTSDPIEVIPEFTTIAIPIVAILGLLFLFSRRRKKAG